MYYRKDAWISFLGLHFLGKHVMIIWKKMEKERYVYEKTVDQAAQAVCGLRR